MNNSNNELLIDLNGLNTFKDKIEHKIPDISYSNGQLTKTINGTTTPIASAVQIVSDGGGGSSISGLMVETTYANLVSLRNNSQLVPGQQYRITDYECTTKQEETKSALHPFDIIVEAIEPNVLSEKALATLHEGDNYFSTYGVDLAAWELKYCLDNNTTKFTWALGDNDSHIQIDGRTFPRLASADSAGSLRPYAWGWTDNDILYTVSDEPEVGDLTYTSATDTEEEGVAITAIPAGKGVIYWMKDDRDNIMPYDFKNIMFRRYKNTSSQTRINGNYHACRPTNISTQHPVDVTAEDLTDFNWFYTFSSTQKNSARTDNSVVTSNIYQCIVEGYASVIPNNVWGSSAHRTKIGSGCNRNTATSTYDCNIGSDCTNNYFYILNEVVIEEGLSNSNIWTASQVHDFFVGRGCNSLYLQCSTGGTGNHIADHCSNINIGMNCQRVTIGSFSRYITLNRNVNYCTIGRGCNYLTLGSSARYCSFADDCFDIILAGSCLFNTFGAGCTYIELGPHCQYNTFEAGCFGADDGQGSYTFKLAANCNYNKFALGCAHLLIDKEYVEHIKMDNCQYVTLTSSLTTAAASKLQNLEIKGIKGVSGTPKVISHDTLNDDFITTYQPKNSQTISV